MQTIGQPEETADSGFPAGTMRNVGCFLSLTSGG